MTYIEQLNKGGGLTKTLCLLPNPNLLVHDKLLFKLTKLY